MGDLVDVGERQVRKYSIAVLQIGIGGVCDPDRDTLFLITWNTSGLRY